MKTFLTLLLFVFSGSLYSQTLIQNFTLPNNAYYNSGYGLVNVGNALWMSSGSSTVGKGVLYKLDYDALKTDSLVINYYTIKESQGLASDGTNFWYVDRKTALCDLYKVSPAGVVLDSIILRPLFRNTSVYVGGAAFEDNAVWVSIYYPNNLAALYKIDVTTKTIRDSIPIFGTQPQGITVKGDTLFYVMDGFEGQPERIYALSLATHDTLFSFPLPEQPGIRQNPRGLAWDGRYFWLLAEPVGASTGRALFKYDLQGSGTPSINLITKTINYGNVQIDSTRRSSIEINNYGSADLIIDSAIVSGADFTLHAVLPLTIKPDSTKSLPITFKPTQNRVYKDSVLFYHNDPNFVFSKTLLNGAGVYTLPFILLSENSLNYGNKRVKSSGYKTLTITNKGSDELIIDSAKTKTRHFFFQKLNTPIVVDSQLSKSISLWFIPETYTNFSDTLTLYTNASNIRNVKIPLSGAGAPFDSTLGKVVWEADVPDNPNTNYDDYTARFIKDINDINGDGVNDLIVTTDNYLTVAFNGNSSVWGDVLWIFNSGTNNNNTGKVERMNSIQVMTDISGDSINDVVVGFGGGNEMVYAINGVTGEKLWEFGDSVNYGDGDINGIAVESDWNNDGKPDVLVSQSGNEFSGEGKFSAYALDGLTGTQIWRIDHSATKKMKDAIINIEDGGAVSSHGSGASNGEILGFDKNGLLMWAFPTLRVAWGLAEIENIGGLTTTDVIAADVGGNVYGITGDAGAAIWTASVGNNFIEDILMVPDLNNSGTDDILVSALTGNLYILEGSTGATLFVLPTGGVILGAGVLGDLNNDGLPEVGAGTYNPNNSFVFETKAGQQLFTYAGGNDAIECIWKAGDADKNGSFEYAIGTREGRVIVFSGGTDVPTGAKFEDILPSDFSLEQNYPNPFNPETVIEYRLPLKSAVTLKIFDILGNEIKTLVNEEQQQGKYTIGFDASRLASGVYFYRLNAGDFSSSKKMLLLK
ncbi:MAG: choice-of-anchor D domain-containing protein [Ignavibacteriaceae bacterium]